MKNAPAKPRRWLPLTLLLLVCGGLLTLLVRQRREMAQEKRREAVQQAAQFMSRMPEDPLAPMTPAEWAQLKELDPETNLDRHLQRLTSQAQAAESKFRKAFGDAGRMTASIRSNPRATTTVEYDEQYTRYYQRDVDAYLATTKDPPAVRDAGELFLKASFFNEHPTEKPVTFALLGRMAEEVLRDSQDPLLRGFALFRIAPNDTSDEIAKRIETEVLNGLKRLSQDSPPQAELVLRAALKHRVKIVSDPQYRLYRQARLNQAAVRWLKAESPATEWHRCIYRRLTDVVDEGDWPQLLALAAGEPEIEPYFLHLLAGNYYLNRASRARGSEYADKVKQEQWEQYYAFSDKAMTHLHHAWFLHPEYPVAAQLMITATLGNDDDGRTRADWFEKSIQAQFDYYPAYSTYIYSLLPRWGGSELEMIAFGQECVATDRFDTAVPYILLLAIDMFDGWEKHPAETLFANFPTLEPALDTFCRQRAAWMRDVSGLQKPYEWNLFPDDVIRVYLANQRFEKARQVALALPDDFRPQRLSRNLRPGGYELAKLKASTEPVRERIDDLDRRLRRDRPQTWSAEDDAKLTEDLARLKELATEPGSQPLLRHLEAMIGQRRALARGEWVDLLNGPDAAGWEFYASTANYDDETQLWSLNNNGYFDLPILGRPLLGLPLPLEIEAEVVLPESVLSREFASVRGIAWAPAEGIKPDQRIAPEERSELLLFGLAPNRGKIQASFPRGCSTGLRGNMSSAASRQTMRLRLWSDAFEFHVGGLAICDRTCAPLDPARILTFGEPLQVSRYRDNGEVQLGRIRVRRLDQEPIASRQSPREERLAYWQRRRDADPQDNLALRELARLKAQTAPAEGLALARQLQEQCPQLNGIHATLGMALVKLGEWDEAERELKIADNEFPYEPIVNVWLVELCLGRPEPTPAQYQYAQAAAKNLASEGEPCQSQALLARLAFAQRKFDEAVSFNTEALRLASDVERAELEARQTEYQAALEKSKP